MQNKNLSTAPILSNFSTGSTMKPPANPGTSYSKPLAARGFDGFVDFTKSGLSFGEKFTYGLYEKFSKWSRSWFTHLFLMTILALYTVGGALLFGTIEGSKSNTQYIENKLAQDHFMQSMKHLVKDFELKKFSTEEFDGKLVHTLREHRGAVENLIASNSILDQLTSPNEKWSLWNAMFYCGTIYTTIGFGYMKPTTTLGQALTIVYAIIGIPIFLILMADLGKLFTRRIKFVWRYVRRLYYTGTCRRIMKQQQIHDAMTGLTTIYDKAVQRPKEFLGMPRDTDIETQATQATVASPYVEVVVVDDEFNLPISVASSVLILYILLGVLMYTSWEDWTYFEAFFIVFMSMSTIDFADVEAKHPIIMMCSIVYLIFGLSLTSMFINVVQIKLSDTFKDASAKIGSTLRVGLANKKSEDDSQLKTTGI